jgi:hypothetical protein
MTDKYIYTIQMSSERCYKGSLLNLLGLDTTERELSEDIMPAAIILPESPTSSRDGLLNMLGLGTEQSILFDLISFRRVMALEALAQTQGWVLKSDNTWITKEENAERERREAI